AGIDCPPELALRLRPRHLPPAHRLVEERHPVPTAFLGAVGSQVGITDESLRGVRPTCRERDSDACRDRQLTGAEWDRLADGVRQSLGDALRLRNARDLLAKHDELVPAKARCRIAWSERDEHPLSDRPQDLVPGFVSEAV